MGFNTVVLIRNDALHEIMENSLEFVEGIQKNMSMPWREKPIDFRVGNNGNPACIVSCSHADDANLIFAGSNTAKVITDTSLRGSEEWVGDKHCQIAIIDIAAHKLGFKLVKLTDNELA